MKPKANPNRKEEEPKYNQAVALEICRRHFEGETLREIFKDKNVGVNRSNFYVWLHKNPDLQDHYRRAREGWADSQHDLMLERSKQAKDCVYIDREGNRRVDTGGVKAIEIEIHTIQWVISRAHSKKYGAKVEDDQAVAAQLPQITIEAQPKLAEPLK